MGGFQGGPRTLSFAPALPYSGRIEATFGERFMRLDRAHHYVQGLWSRREAGMF